MLIVGLPYAWSPVYRFPEPAPFTGPRWYNPYASGQGAWQRVNLHAHGRSWGGLTNGAQSSEEVVRTYKALGYDVAGVSNYHSIAARQGVDTLPLYEHGYNIRKRHQLAIGATHVDWTDYPLWQWPSQQQFVIDRVARTAALVGLTHPGTRDAYSDDDLRQLTGYHLMEVVNGPFEAIAPWDAALSSGHAVWGMANDDTHDTSDARRTAKAWNMVDAPSPGQTDIVSALRAGRAYAVEWLDDGPGAMDVRGAHLAVDDDTLTVIVDGYATEIEFVGQHGRTRAKVEGRHHAQYRFHPQDTYIRTVVRTPHTKIFLNPVLRTGANGQLPARRASVDPIPTWGLRAGVVAVMVTAVGWLWPVRVMTRSVGGVRSRADSAQEAD